MYLGLSPQGEKAFLVIRQKGKQGFIIITFVQLHSTCKRQEYTEGTYFYFLTYLIGSTTVHNSLSFCLVPAYKSLGQ